MSRQLVTQKAREAFVAGCAFYGVGGGGDPSRGLGILTEAAEEDVPLRWVPPEELDDDLLVACTWGMGTIAPETEARREKMRRLGLHEPVETESMQRAIREMEKEIDRDIGAIIALEPGGTNMANPLVTAGRMGLPFLDADLAGRAIPEITQTLPVIDGGPVTPMTSVDGWGNTCVIKETFNPHLIERIGKLLSQATYRYTHMCGFVQTVAELRRRSVPGTVSRCRAAGESIHQAREAGRDPLPALCAATGARVIFAGYVTDREWRDEDGYMMGSASIGGAGDYAGHQLRLWYKNEHHISWLDGQPFVTSPDLISIVRLPAAEPVTNTDLTVGMDVAVVVLPAHEKLRSDRGLHLLGPSHFGWDIDYVPLEERLRNATTPVRQTVDCVGR